MRAGRLLGGLLLAAAPLPAAAAEAAYPWRPVLDAFKAACGTRAAVVAAQGGTAPAGWTAVDPATTPVGPVLDLGRAAGEKLVAGNGKLLGQGVFRRDVAGERLYIIVSGADRAAVRVVGCRLYDPGEQRAVDAAAVAAWVGRKPDAAVDRAELTKLTWEPGFVAGSDSFELFRVPATSPLKAVVKLDGLAMKIDWAGEAK